MVFYGNAQFLATNENHLKEDGLRHFLNCLAHGVNSEMPVASVLFAVRACEAIKKSAKEKRIVQVKEIY